MRTTLKHTLAALAALGALMLTGTACTQDDPLGGNNPAGTQLLQLGKVTIAGAETATRSTDATTRADATTGYTGIRKTSFVKNDKLVLTLNDGKGNPNSSTEVTATLSADGTTWTLDPVKTYFTAGTTVSATHTPTQTIAGTAGTAYGDKLVTAQPVELKTNGTPLALTLTHANAMVEVTPPAGIDYKDLTISATPSGAADAEVLSHVTQGTGTNLRHHTIAPAGATLNSISLTVNTVVYTAPITPEVVVAPNKRYPITLTITGDKLEATVAAGTNWDDGGDVEGHPTGRTRYISTPQDLQQLAADVNADVDGTGARIADVLQTADIDMKDVTNWVPIGNDYDHHFKGSYNGNGYSISNLKMGGSYATNQSVMMGLFGYVVGAKITGVHFRDCTITTTQSGTIYAGALAGVASTNCIITLCSATGSITATGTKIAHVGGLVGEAYAYDTKGYNHFTRCTAKVDVTVDATNTDSYIGAFAGLFKHVQYVGCIASGKVTKQNAGYSSGFSYAAANAAASSNYHAMGCITNSEIVNPANISTLAFGSITSIRSCLATQPSYNYFYVNTSDATDNVSLGTATGGSNSTAPAAARGLLTATNTASPIKIKTLHYSATDGYTLNVVEQYWYAYGIWKDNGTALPTIDMSYEGNPEPITAGNKVYRVNGYWVTMPGATENPQSWNSNLNGQTMESDPCATADAIAKGWRMPTMKDFEKMAGWEVRNPWSQTGASTATYDLSNAANFSKAFPSNTSYWSSDASTNAGETDKAWRFIVVAAGVQAAYAATIKTDRRYIRCVQEIAP